ncbi:glucose-1-phosphate cytidylyltransferase [bacterium 1XD42-94]|nr:glucose-1-phosphate cytidylyltransferase [bacterium 1XD42-76]NBK04274.1 glucose-1-phosphate cytidylyltransferase [bacterium 1XD42-94]
MSRFTKTAISAFILSFRTSSAGLPSTLKSIPLTPPRRADPRQSIKSLWQCVFLIKRNLTSDVTFDFKEHNKWIVHKSDSEPWRVTIADTGLNTMTGGRIKRIQNYVNDEPFFLTYGDAVSNVNLKQLLEFHRRHGKAVTLTTVNIAQQKGVLSIGKDNTIVSFREKVEEDGAIINGGFMVCNPEIFEYLHDDQTVLEQEPMRKLAGRGELKSFFHNGFWQCMDTKREKDLLEKLWASGDAPWKTWTDVQTD